MNLLTGVSCEYEGAGASGVLQPSSTALALPTASGVAHCSSSAVSLPHPPPPSLPAGGLSKRASLMLDLIVDIKNNRPSAAGAKAKGTEGRRGGALAVLSPGVAKWVKGCGVDDICLRNLTWAKLLAPDKKGAS